MKENPSVSDRRVMVSRHLGGQVILAAGSVDFTGRERSDQAILAGLKFVVVLSGSSTIRLGTEPPLRLAATTALVILNERAVERDQIFGAETTYRYALVDIDPKFVRDEMGIDPKALCPLDAQGLGILSRRASSIEQALAAQILACPLGREHNLLRLAKALELAATMLDSMRGRGRILKGGRLTGAEIESIHEAKSRLLLSLANPPDQAELAAAVGLNTRKLSLGFRTVFGATPYAFLQEERLQEAYRRLAGGASSVSEVSYAVGYGPAHFATLFSRRFGIPPSSLLAAKAHLT